MGSTLEELNIIYFAQRSYLVRIITPAFINEESEADDGEVACRSLACK